MDANGNVGIGTTQPKAPFFVQSAITMNNAIPNYIPYPLDFYEEYTVPSATWYAYPGASSATFTSYPYMKFIRIGRIVNLAMGQFSLLSIGTTPYVYSFAIPDRFTCSVEYCNWPLRELDNAFRFALLYYHNNATKQFQIFLGPDGGAFTGGSGTTFTFLPINISYTTN